MLNAYRMLRLDRLVTLVLFRPLLRLKLIKKNPGIPILMYHSISDDIQPGLHPYFQTSTSPNTFRMHMSFLKENGYTVLPLKEAVGLLSTGQGYGRKAVVLTFDDGFKDFHIVAFPILQAYGFPCTVFLPTAFVDDQNSKFRDKSCLSWDEVRELHSHGVVFGSHTVTHPQLTALNLDDITTELEHSKARIEVELGTNIESFSYPFAFPEENANFVKSLRQLLQSLGYQFGVTTKIGIAGGADSSFFFRRIPLNEFDDTGLLQAKLSGAYDWIYPFQQFSKYLKAMLKGQGGTPAFPLAFHEPQEGIQSFAVPTKMRDDA